MNILQRLRAEQQYCVTLNPDRTIKANKIIRRIQYQHPIYSPEAIAAQGRQEELNYHRTFYCGAYWRNGFHEDGVVSALNAVRHFEEKLEHGQLHLRRAS
jgi:predicted NAD/FAD-binding protein